MCDSGLEVGDAIFLDSKRLEEYLSIILLPILYETGVIRCITWYTQWFIRTSDEKTRFQDDNDLKLGDIIYSAPSRIVFSDTKTEPLLDFGGYYHIPKFISRWIENPIAFYDRHHQYFEIELDATCHQKILETASGNRRVSNDAEVFYNWNGGIQIHQYDFGGIKIHQYDFPYKSSSTSSLTPETNFSNVVRRFAP